MIRPRIPSGAPPEPLAPAELSRVLGWQRRMYWFYSVAMIMIAGGFYLMGRFADTSWIRPALLVMLLALMAAGAWVQFRERCPRCGTLLGRQSRFILPAKCKSCGVGFPRADEADHAPRA
jgi:hypothetical protein